MRTVSIYTVYTPQCTTTHSWRVACFPLACSLSKKNAVSGVIGKSNQIVCKVHAERNGSSEAFTSTETSGAPVWLWACSSAGRAQAGIRPPPPEPDALCLTVGRPLRRVESGCRPAGAAAPVHCLYTAQQRQKAGHWLLLLTLLAMLSRLSQESEPHPACLQACPQVLSWLSSTFSVTQKTGLWGCLAAHSQGWTCHLESLQLQGCKGCGPRGRPLSSPDHLEGCAPQHLAAFATLVTTQ